MRLILNILLIAVIASTFFICISKPDMHKNVVVYDSAYSLKPSQETVTETKEVPIMEMPAKQEKVIKKEEQTAVTSKNETKKENVKTTKTTVTKPKVIQNTYKIEQKQPMQKTEPKVIQKTLEQKVLQQVKKEEPQKIQKVETNTQPKVLTQKEEEIAWNIWRSNLQNKIMQDTKLPIIQNGIVFRFSFTVDKYGKISNLQTWSETPSYNPYAIQYIAPVIRNLQGRSILNFPNGSSRVMTEVKGGWRISANERYSTPQDYNDIEKIK